MSAAALTAAEEELKPYLARSAGLHAGLAVVLIALLRRAPAAPDERYNIDFIGPSAAILNREAGGQPAKPTAAAPAPAAAAKPPPLTNPDEFPVRARRPLPRPSILQGLFPEAPAKPAPKTPEISAAAAARPTAIVPHDEDRPAPEAAGTGAQGAPGAVVDADMPNFPYPWYISQVRTSLWSQWSSHMPAGAAEATVMFTLLRNGSVVDLRVESSSGDSAFDFQAMSAVQDSAPFPHLPPGFREPFLKIHVKFRSQ